MQDVRNLQDESAKDATYDSNAQPDNRVAMSRGLNQEAQRLWRLVSEGEAAMSQWPLAELRPSESNVKLTKYSLETQALHLKTTKMF